MKIKSITVGGFKNLDTTRLELDKICAIISTNNYGKSNLLEAIDFGIDFLQDSRQLRKNMMLWTKGIPLCKSLEDSEYIFEIEFEDEKLEEYRFVRYGYSFKWHRDDGNGARITDEWLDIRANESVRYKSFIKRKESKYKKDNRTNSFRKVELDDLQLILDKLVVLDDIEINKVAKAVRQIDYRICSSLDLNDRFQPTPIEYVCDDDSIVNFDDSDVPKALNKLKKACPEKYELFEEAVFDLFPDFTEIILNEYVLSDKPSYTALDIKEGNTEILREDVVEEKIPFKICEQIYRMFIKSENLNQSISISNMSNGTRRMIWLLANVFLSSYLKTCMIGVEEVETSIHPRMMKQLLEILSEALEDTPLIVSSHSPYLIQYLKPEKIYVGVPNEKGIAYFRKIDSKKVKDLVKDSRDMGMSVGEYLFELLSGDDDSTIILKNYLEENI